MVNGFSLPLRRRPPPALNRTSPLNLSAGHTDELLLTQGSQPVNMLKTDNGEAVDDGEREGEETPDLQVLVKDDQWLLDTAIKMRDSGMLRIKSHKKGLMNYKDTFKGQYAVEWMTANKVVKTVEEAIFLGESMIHAGYMRHIHPAYPHFHASSELYVFMHLDQDVQSTVDRTHFSRPVANSQYLGNSLAVMRRRMGEIESRLKTQATQLVALESARTVVMQLEFRAGAAEAHVEAVEQALAAALHVQTLALWALLALLLLQWAPQPAAALGRCFVATFLVLLAMRSHRTSHAFHNLKIDYAALVESVAASFKVPVPSPFAAAAASLASVDESLSLDAPPPPEPPSPHRTVSALDVPLSPSAAAAAAATAQSAPGALSNALSKGARRLKLSLDIFPPTRRRTSQQSNDASPRVEEPWQRLDAEAGASLPLRRMTHAGTALGGASPRASGSQRSSMSGYPHLRRETWNGQVPPESNARPSSSGRDQPSGDNVANGISAQQGSFHEATFDGLATNPVLVRQAELPGHSLADPHVQMTANQGDVHDFESPGFRGKIVMWIRGLPMAPGREVMFKDRRRQSWFTVQGRFKTPMPMSEVWTGQHLSRPAKNLPAVWFLNSCLQRIGRSLAPSARIGDLQGPPSMLFPLITMAQAVCVSPPGQEPDILGPPVEDVRALGIPDLVRRDGQPAAASKRQAFFDRAQNREAHQFDTEHVYTFHIWQHAVDLSTYKLAVIFKPSLIQYLDGQPLSFMARTGGADPPDYLWKFDVWHRALMPAHEAHVHSSSAKRPAALALSRTSAPAPRSSTDWDEPGQASPRPGTAAATPRAQPDDRRELRTEISLGHQLKRCQPAAAAAHGVDRRPSGDAAAGSVWSDRAAAPAAAAQKLVVTWRAPEESSHDASVCGSSTDAHALERTNTTDCDDTATSSFPQVSLARGLRDITPRSSTASTPKLQTDGGASHHHNGMRTSKPNIVLPTDESVGLRMPPLLLLQDPAGTGSRLAASTPGEAAGTTNGKAPADQEGPSRSAASVTFRVPKSSEANVIKGGCLDGNPSVSGSYTSSSGSVAPDGKKKKKKTSFLKSVFQTRKQDAAAA